MTGADIRDHRLIYGCMGLGGGWDTQPYAATDIASAEAAISAALEAGISAFDHADIYRYGKSEAVFGEILTRSAGLRERIVIQTKCGIRLPTTDQIGHYDLRPDSIRSRVEESLARLRTDFVDVLLLHRPDPLAEPERIAEAFTDLHRQGLVRQFGVSNMSGPQIAHLQRHLDLPLVANQMEISLRRRDLIEAPGTIEHCQAHGIGLQAWGPLAQGRFTQSPATPAEEATAALVAKLAEEKHTTPETVVLWWLRRHPARIAPVIGTTRPERIGACRDVVDRDPELTHEEWYRLWVTARDAALP